MRAANNRPHFVSTSGSRPTSAGFWVFFHPSNRTMMTMLYTTVTLLLCTFCPLTLLAQTASTGKAPTPPQEYRLQVSYRAGVAQNYEIDEVTKVVRTHSDGNKISYDRTIKYYTTVRCIESMNGVATLAINLDSLTYAFTSEGVTVTYDSQKDITIKNFADLNNYHGPLNRTFELTVSPYGEISKVTGEQIDFWRDYIEENKNDLDSVLYLIWSQSLDKTNLLQYGDLQKRIIPGLKVAIDSTWDHSLRLRIDGVIYDGRVTSKLTEYSGGYFTIQTSDTLKAEPQQIHAYKIPYVSTVTEGTAIVDHVTSMTTQGVLNDIVSKVTARFRATVGKEDYTHDVTSTTTWKLIGQYQW